MKMSTATERNDLLAAALAYVERAIPVFPCKPNKSPLTPHGFKNATTDPQQIMAWWTRWPNALIGVPTGTQFDVLDLDVKNGKDGLAVIPNWTELTPLIACTGNGGRHLYFKPNGSPCTSDELALGVDTRGVGGYVIVPPSHGYTWFDDKNLLAFNLAELPEWPPALRMPVDAEPHEADDLKAVPELGLLEAALEAIPNPNLGWDAWNRVGMATFAASGGTEPGLAAFDSFSRNSTKYNEQETRKRWDQYRKSPPQRINFGTLHYMASQASPGWQLRHYEQNPMPDWVIASVDAIIKSAKARLMQSSAGFVGGFVPPDYLIDGLLQRRYFYSLTAPTGTGKTCVLLLLALHVALGFSLDNREVTQGRVLIFAGENPDDVRCRWVKLCENCDVDPADVDVFFVPGTPAITATQVRKQIDEEAEKNGPFNLVIIDTAAAYFPGDDENSTQMGQYARALRTFTTLPGGPTVIVSCHPVKNYDINNLLPRGAGLFVNEVDGNLVLKNEGGDVVTITWHGKFRGPEFNPFSFRIKRGKTEKLQDAKGRLIWTVAAEPITESEKTEIEQASHNDQNDLLRAMEANPGFSLTQLAEACGWYTLEGVLNKSKAQRVMEKLKEDKLVVLRRGRYELTKLGEDALLNMQAASSAF